MLFTQTLTTLLKVENKGSKVVSLTAIYKSNVEPECRTRKMGEYYRDTIE